LEKSSSFPVIKVWGLIKVARWVTPQQGLIHAEEEFKQELLRRRKKVNYNCKMEKGEKVKKPNRVLCSLR